MFRRKITVQLPMRVFHFSAYVSTPKGPKRIWPILLAKKRRCFNHLKHHQLPDGWTTHGNRRPSGRRPDTSAERSPVTERGIGQAKKLPWGFVDSTDSIKKHWGSSWDMKMGILCIYIYYVYHIYIYVYCVCIYIHNIYIYT